MCIILNRIQTHGDDDKYGNWAYTYIHAGAREQEQKNSETNTWCTHERRAIIRRRACVCAYVSNKRRQNTRSARTCVYSVDEKMRRWQWRRPYTSRQSEFILAKSEREQWALVHNVYSAISAKPRGLLFTVVCFIDYMSTYTRKYIALKLQLYARNIPMAEKRNSP